VRPSTKYRTCHILNIVIHSEDYYAPIAGEFEQLVLIALFRLGNGAYGAAILREIRERTGREVAVGALYMTLKRLTKKKMVCAYVGDPSPYRGGRRRKHYLIDTAGQRALGRAYRVFTTMAEGIQGELEKL
jgi:PadR family transcriptional regulator, regulatory protein PadR